MSALESRCPEPTDTDADYFEGVVLDDAELLPDSAEESRWGIEGYLKRKGQRSILGKKRWSKKYFRVDFAEGKLYCSEKHGAQPISVLDVRDITCVVLLSAKKSRFDIIVDRVKEFELETSSPEDARAWYQYLTFCILKKQHEVFAGEEEKPGEGPLKGPVNANILCGKMKKRYEQIMNQHNHQVTSVWQTRAWKLIEDRKLLAYFDEKGKVLGLIPVEMITSITRNQNNECRFALIVKTNPPRMFDLLAPNVLETEEWIYRLSKFQCVSIPSPLRKDGELRWKDAESLAPKVDQQVATRLKAASLSGSELEAVVLKMQEGGAFKRHEIRDDGSLHGNIGTIHYDPSKQVLTWRGAHCALRINVSSITDLVVGCGDKAFGPPTQKPAANCCFSVDCKNDGYVLHLEAKTNEQAEMWLSGLQSLVRGMAKARQSDATPLSSEDPHSEVTTLMQQGGHFVCYEETSSDQNHIVVTKRKIFLYYEADRDMGTVFWCGAHERTKAFAMHLKDITQIALGKTTRPLLSPQAENADESRCFALIGANFTLSLEAESCGKRGVWVGGIHRILSAAKKVDRKPISNDEAIDMCKSPPRPKHQPAEVPVELSALVGSRFKKYDMNSTKTASVCEVVKVWFTPSAGRLGSLFWGNPDAPPEERSECSLPLHTLTGGYLGKHDQAFHLPGASQADESCCFTLTSKHGSPLNLEAPNETTRQRWLAAIQAHVMLHALKKNDPAMEAAVSLLMKGRMFVLHENDSHWSAFVYYRPSSSQPQGYLCWKDSPTAPENPNNMFPLRQLREMVGGKQSSAFQKPEAAQIDANCCLVLFGTRSELALQAESKAVRSEWFSALNKVMSVSSKTKNDGVPPEGLPSPSKTPRRADTPRVGERKAPPPPTPDDIKLPLWDDRMRRFAPTVDPDSVFEVVQFLAKGAYGKVYLGVSRADGSQWALKIMRAEPDSIRDIQNEVEILKNCRSPHIVALGGVYVKRDRVWIAMEYCAAGSLTQMMSICQRTLTEKQIASVLRMCLLGLQHLHAQNIIHRDLKGANVLVTEAGDCKLGDFGVSAEVRRTLAGKQPRTPGKNKQQTVIGTPCYMAPEVIGGEKYDQKADMWSLGIVAIELATGEPPHCELHQMAAFGAILNGPPPRLPEHEKWSPDFRNFVEILLQKIPAARPTCTQLLEHPFVRNARSKTALKSFVNDCFVEMRSARDLDQAVAAAPNSTLAYGS